ncbi:exonuclease [Anaeramoeba flamelloides]|uniref:Exonuclease 1 n=1 Tax=Anaeramoeba flamelloides TaxID=1746091 RepID=A0AAV8A1S0_9EUKA|nr:exonuclease [Anaeramoeba flamelloides]
MGITGLFKLLESIKKKSHLRNFKGKTIGIDGYVILHRGAFRCAKELCLNNSSRTLIRYVLNFVKLLRRHQIKPYFVFDGSYLPMKAETNKKRNEDRERSLEIAVNLTKSGRQQEAHRYFQRSVKITSKIANQVIQALKKDNVPILVSPYEADPQLAWLARNGIIDLVLSSDSDLLVFGVPHFIYKFEMNGSVEIIHLADVYKIGPKPQPKLENKKASRRIEINFQGWTHDQFIFMCILSGCDYLKSINGIEKEKEKEKEKAKEKEGEKEGEGEGEGETEKEEENNNFNYLGPKVSDEIAKKIANSLIDPFSHKEFSVTNNYNNNNFYNNRKRNNGSYTQSKTPTVNSSQFPKYKKRYNSQKIKRSNSRQPNFSRVSKSKTINNQSKTILDFFQKSKNIKKKETQKCKQQKNLLQRSLTMFPKNEFGIPKLSNFQNNKSQDDHNLNKLENINQEIVVISDDEDAWDLINSNEKINLEKIQNSQLDKKHSSINNKETMSKAMTGKDKETKLEKNEIVHGRIEKKNKSKGEKKKEKHITDKENKKKKKSICKNKVKVDYFDEGNGNLKKKKKIKNNMKNKEQENKTPKNSTDQKNLKSFDLLKDQLLKFELPGEMIEDFNILKDNLNFRLK